MTVYALGDQEPDIHPSAYVHPDAVVIGNVVIGAESSVWPGAVLRGDDGFIYVGDQTSIQDGVVVHTTRAQPTRIGSRCTIGHNAHLEGCTVHDKALVGSGSVVLHRSVIGEEALVGANALVGNDKVVPPRARALGIPAKITEDVVEPGQFDEGVDFYVARGARYRRELRPLHR
ncbi:MAG: Carnitine operon protein CaiE [Acidimicrobiales bacterium]|nr:MAG: gamma carbonic anhydrase family protein [Actinomycetota bacterium]MBV6510232.1 Carnitine operon protein CaiE [Acidimicrobiales bacterium]RIK04198.1 MAG: gamma carbonic anhydrase family protein [Acidobacteriota bacterium]